MAVRSASALTRLGWALALAILLALRLLAPAGFMPAFNNGAVTIVACPDAALQPVQNHHLADHKSAHQPCPYAAASALGGLVESSVAIAALFVFAIIFSLRPTSQAVLAARLRERPPLRGPPILA
jgi:hypothetical protein